MPREALHSRKGPTFYNFALNETKSEGTRQMYWLVIHCCITNHPKPNTAEIILSLPLMVLGLLGSARQILLVGLSCCRSQMAGGGDISKAFSLKYLVLGLRRLTAVGWHSWVPGLSVWSFHTVFIAWYLRTLYLLHGSSELSRWVSCERKPGGRCIAFYHLALEITQHLFLLLL